jgi:tRNA A-37 threonylcarbamoyl transferase component Bud32/tetratricopeptide (TPR) repeat protein
VSVSTPDLIETRTANEKQRETSSIAPAKALGRYTVLAKIGEGGMGQVYSAYDPKLDRRVALKVLHRLESTADAKRLIREAKALARLSHPNVVTVHEVDELVDSGGQPLIAMEFVEGRTLKHWVRRADGPAQSTAERLELLVQAGRGLVAAHREGLVHRDFKPGNVLIGLDGRVRVADFGLAVADDSTSADLKVDGEASVDSSLTRTGVLVGTPAYMAPEQFTGNPVDTRCDQFSFCVTAWEVLFGVRPYAGTKVNGLRAAFRGGGMKRPEEVDVPGPVEAALRKGLSVRANARFGTTAELVQLLETELRVLKGEHAPPAKLQAWKYLVAAALLAVTVWGLAKARKSGLVAACEARAGEVGDLWNEQVRGDVLTALRSTPEGELIHDEDRLSRWLDKHATELQTATLEICRHQTVEQDWSPALLEKADWCITERRIEFQDELEGFQSADAEAATFAIGRALALRPLDPCLDRRALEELAVPPEEQREELRTLKRKLNEASRLGAGSREQQLAIVRQLGEEAVDLGWGPMVINTLREEGAVLSELGNTEGAAEAWEDAWFQAAESSEWQLATMLARDVSHVASSSNKDITKARFWLSLGRVSQQQSYDPSGSLELSLLELEVAVESVAGNTDKAEQLSRQLVSRTEALFGPDHYETADALELLGATLQLKAKYEEAEDLRNRAINIQLKLFGKNRKKLASDLLNIALTQRYLGKFTKAKESTEVAYEIMRTTAPDDPQLAVILMGLAVSTLEAGDSATGVLRGEEALELARAHHKPGNTHIIDVLATVGDILRLLNSIESPRRSRARPSGQRIGKPSTRKSESVSLSLVTRRRPKPSKSVESSSRYSPKWKRSDRERHSLSRS